VITAAMIFMAAAAALFVLPSLLLLTYREPKRSSWIPSTTASASAERMSHAIIFPPTGTSMGKF